MNDDRRMGLAAHVAAVALLSRPREERASLHARFALAVQRDVLLAIERIRAVSVVDEATRAAASPLLSVLLEPAPAAIALPRVGLVAFGRIDPDLWLPMFAAHPEFVLRDSNRWLKRRDAHLLLAHVDEVASASSGEAS